MKNLLYILFLAVFQFTFSQEKVNINLFDNSVFSETILDNNSDKIFESELKTWSKKETKLTNEGKFLLNSDTEKFFGKILKSSENPKVALDKKNLNLEVDSKKLFVDKVVLEKLKKEIEKLLLNNTPLSYGDKMVKVVDLDKLENRLIINKRITEKIELQIGKSLYTYLNKINKTELDKTLANSLNLIAINF